MVQRAWSAGRCLLIALTVGVMAGCSAVSSTSNMEPASTQNLVFYPGLVKGFEHTYPARHVLVLAVTDACNNHNQPAGDNSGLGQQIGVTLDTRGEQIQRLFATDLTTTVQKAIEQAVQEAGMVSSGSSDTQYNAQAVDADYVLQSRLTKCWVRKQRVMDSDKNASWQTVAEFALDVTIYKPPFHVPFWQGTSSETYSDPPDNPGLMPEDTASIYDEPGEVLSVAFTRSAEGLFKRSDLRALIIQDRALRH